MARKELQMSRMWQYFVDATVKIIEEEGIEAVTVRKVAELAGYTSSTIYNYFDELSHLVFFASMRFLESYTQELSYYMKHGKNSLEKYLKTWECFCKHSYSKPQIYQALFISDLGSHPEELLRKYYDMYNQDLTDLTEDTKSLIFETNISKRSHFVLKKAAEEGLINSNNLEEINEIGILIWKGMLTTILSNRRSYTPEEATHLTMKYIKQITLNSFNFDPSIADLKV